jgi:hypothetical protein
MVIFLSYVSLPEGKMDDDWATAIGNLHGSAMEKFPEGFPAGSLH